MQASKIKVDTVYAVKHPDNGKLSRYRVTEVVTRRRSNHGNPHDFKSTVEGFIVDDVKNGEAVMRTLGSDDVIGPYEQHVELVERKKKEAPQGRREFRWRVRRPRPEA
jgi:hypothetical protein